MGQPTVRSEETPNLLGAERPATMLTAIALLPTTHRFLER
jgi:hypothetical protein